MRTLSPGAHELWLALTPLDLLSIPGTYPLRTCYGGSKNFGTLML
jgi:hypothetical protein